MDWPAVTMDFAVAKDVNLTNLKQGVQIAFMLSRGADGIYTIDGVTARQNRKNRRPIGRKAVDHVSS